MYKDLMKPDEDWTNLSNNVDRRRIQNRIAQRAYRRSMKEHRIEVEHLRETIKHLEGTAAAHTATDVVIRNALGTSSDAVRTFDEDPWLKMQEGFGDGENQRDGVTTPRTLRPDQAIAVGLQSSASMNNSRGLNGPPESGGRQNAETPMTSFCPWLQTTCSPQNRGPQMPDMLLIQDQLQKDNSLQEQSSLSSQSRGSMADNASPALINHGQSPTSDATQYAVSSVGEIDITPWSDVDNPPAQRLSTNQTPPPSYGDPGLTFPHRGSSLLHLAVASGNADTLRILLQYTVTSTRDIAGYTPLERAVLAGRTDLVKILLEHGIENANQIDNSEL
ncbi:hypothetical protein Q7P37_008235 [Cladosporium fusiforme]